MPKSEADLMTLEEWLAKAEAEGGILQGLEYGLRADDIISNIDQYEPITAIYRIEMHYDAMREDLMLLEQWEPDE